MTDQTLDEVTGDHRTTLFLLGLAGLLGLSVLIALSFGAFQVSLLDMILSEISDQQTAVLSYVRLPRVVLSILVGASLAVTGAAMQGLFRNPLADPGLIGISSGAALAVAIVIVLFGSSIELFGLYGLSFAAFIGGLLTCLLIFRFANAAESFSVTYMLLAGIAINAIAGAGVGFLTYLSTDQQLRALSLWTMGSLGSAMWPSVLVISSVVIPTTLILMKQAGALNIMLLGEDDARHLGIDTKKLKRRIIICTALCVGAAVAVSGIIGFVGLVVPHLLRLIIGPDHRILFPASALLGAILLLVADTLARTVVTPAEIPVGLLTSLIGGPFFLWLLIKQYGGSKSYD
jgi:iron complex transport system permease protein